MAGLVVEVVLGHEQIRCLPLGWLPGPWEQRMMHVPVQEAASELEQRGAPELEQEEVSDLKEAGHLLSWRPVPQRG